MPLSRYQLNSDTASLPAGSSMVPAEVFATPFPGRLVAIAKALEPWIGKGDAIGIAAVAAMETRGAALSDVSSPCRRLRLGWELNQYNGAPVLSAGQMSDPVIRNFFLGQNPKGKPLVTNPSANGGMLVDPNVLNHEEWAQALFDAAVTGRSFKALGLLSQGATQQHLIYCGKLQWWPISWGDLWRRHHYDDQTYWPDIRGYLSRNDAHFPIEPGNDAAELAWCKNQTGNATIAQLYWAGEGAWKATRGVKGYANDIRASWLLTSEGKVPT